MNLSPAALSKLWQQQTKPAQVYSCQPCKEPSGKDVEQRTAALTFEKFSATLCADYSSSRIQESE